jgi:hypothetical protein
LLLVFHLLVHVILLYLVIFELFLLFLLLYEKSHLLYKIPFIIQEARSLICYIEFHFLYKKFILSLYLYLYSFYLGFYL